LSDLLWLANTRHGPGGHWFARVVRDEGDHDHLVAADEAVRYLDDHHVSVPAEAPSARQRDDLRVIREMTRGLLEPESGWTQEARAILDRTTFRLSEDGRLMAEGSGWKALIGDLMIPLLQLMELRDRLRICGNPACRLMFLDLSRNRTRQWCDTAGCGNRDRVRRHRTRVAVGGQAES
jgi:hypothetical protein